MTTTRATLFRGLSGEVVSGFVQPGVWATLVPVYLVWILYAMFGAFVTLPSPLDMILAFFIAAVIVGRYAVPATTGNVHSGFFSQDREPGDDLFFAIRALLFTVIWVLPIILATQFFRAKIAPAALLNPSSFMSAGLAGLFMVLLTIIAIMGPTLACIMATATNSFSAPFTSAPYKWLLARAGDLPVFYAALFGGFIVFFIVYLIPILIVCAGVASSNSLSGAVFASMLIMLIPSAASPVLLGRLCGAFVQGQGALNSLTGVSPFVYEDTDDDFNDEELENGDLEQVQPSAKELLPTFTALTGDPEQSVIDWAKKELSSAEKVSMAYLYLRSQDGVEQRITLGIVVDEDLPLGHRGRLMKEIKQKSPPVSVELISGENLAEAQKHGLRIYRKK